MTKRDTNLFRFECNHNHSDGKPPSTFEMPTSLILKVAIEEADTIPGTLCTSQRGADDGLEDMPMILARLTTADKKATTYLFDTGIALNFGHALLEWAFSQLGTDELLNVVKEMMDDAN